MMIVAGAWEAGGGIVEKAALAAAKQRKPPGRELERQMVMLRRVRDGDLGRDDHCVARPLPDVRRGHVLAGLGIEYMNLRRTEIIVDQHPEPAGIQREAGIEV